MKPLHIDLAYRASNRSWGAAILDDEGNARWQSAERFHSADIAYYRAMGQFVLSAADEEALDQDVRSMAAHAA